METSHLLTAIGTLVTVVTFLYFTLIKTKDAQLKDKTEQIHTWKTLYEEKEKWNREHAERSISNYKDFTNLLKQVFAQFDNTKMSVKASIVEKADELKKHVTEEVRELKKKS